MKKLLFVSLFLLGMSAMVSCEKGGGGESDPGMLEGKWWFPTKAEAIFNGSVVETVNGGIDDFNIKAFFENGTCTLIDLEDNSQMLVPYTFSNNVLSLGLESLRITRLTNKEGVLEFTIAEQYSWGVSLYDGQKCDTFKGITILKSDGYYWYNDKNGKAVMCEQTDKKNWYDTVKLYFKAQ